MRKLFASVLALAIMLWATTAFAQYSALGDDEGTYGPTVGIGGVLFSGDDASGGSDSVFLPAINVAGISEFVAWNFFYAFDSDTTAWGGSADWILYDNFDECGGCGNDGSTWFGVGPSFVSYSDLFVDGSGTSGGVDGDDFGLNLGVGHAMDDWYLGLNAHYFFDSEIVGVQASINYNLN